MPAIDRQADGTTGALVVERWLLGIEPDEQGEWRGPGEDLVRTRRAQDGQVPRSRLADHHIEVAGLDSGEGLMQLLPEPPG
jgi:hypothetical protein